MWGFHHVATFDGTGYAEQVSDLRLAQVGGHLMLYSATRSGIGAWTVNTIDAAARAGGGWARPSVQRVLADPQLVLLERPGGWAMVAGGVRGGADNAHALNGNGLRGDYDRRFNASPLPTDVLHAEDFTTARGSHMVAVGRSGTAALSLWTQRSDGTLKLADQAAAPPLLARDARLDAILPLRLGGADLIFTASIRGDFVAAHRVMSDGSLSAGEYVGLSRATGMDGPRLLGHAVVEDHHFLVVGASDSSSLTTIRIMPGGEMVPVDHVIDERTTRFQSMTAMQVVQVGGRAYVVAGGKDGGMSLLALTPDGRLLHLSSAEDQDGQSLTGLSALAAAEVGGRIVVMAGSQKERGISQYVFEPGPIGQTRHVGDGAFTGSDAGDLIQGGAGTTAISGGRGDDILIAGSRAIALTGGNGDDVFVPLAVAGNIVIRDFEPGHDRLDLSLLGMIRSTAQLRMKPFGDGIRIRFGTTTIEVRSRDGHRLDTRLFTDAMFPVAHYTPPDVRTTLVGTSRGDVLMANRGGSSIVAGSGNDTVLGSLLEDFIRGDAGHDRLSGNAGDDTLWGGSGRDLIRGGAGNDVALGGNDSDTLLGEAGDDVLRGEGSRDTLRGDDGNDLLQGGTDSDWLEGGNGNDTLNGQAGNDVLTGGAGSDLLVDLSGDNRFRDDAGSNMMTAGDGRDRLFAGSGNDRMSAGGGDDVLLGGGGQDRMDGGAGNDRMWGQDGNDTLLGSAGNDRMDAGAGDDRMDGGQGNDSLLGKAGDDWLAGGSGNDRIWAGEGVDAVFGDAGCDRLDGGLGNDRIDGGADADALLGGGGNDWVSGGTGDDRLWGGSGQDILNGGAGRDALRAGTGNDVLVGGAGDDWLNGGAGADVFVFAPQDAGGADVIAEFAPGEDRLDLSALHLAEFGGGRLTGHPAEARWVVVDQDVVLSIDIGGDGIADLTIHLAGLAALDPSDVLL